jgi:hypothetical protein
MTRGTAHTWLGYRVDQSEFLILLREVRDSRVIRVLAKLSYLLHRWAERLRVRQGERVLGRKLYERS